MEADYSIWYDEARRCVCTIDQRKLPFLEEVVEIRTLEEAATAIRDMVVRGAPLIGVTAAFGFYLGVSKGVEPSDCRETLLATRPTAVNLRWALDRMGRIIRGVPEADRPALLLQEAKAIRAEDIAMCLQIGEHGWTILERIYQEKGAPVQVLTHCNAGWLATVQWGTATAPIYRAHQKGIPLHVWVDETRPRNQGARLTAWELGRAGIDHHVISDNAGGHLMQHGQVDLVITGSDRTTRRGDVCNKIGTYLKALAAYDNGIPFYAALPSSTIDWTISDGHKDIVIEERSGRELTSVDVQVDGLIQEVDIMPADTRVRNYAFDVTPARLVTRLITEKGICRAEESALAAMFGR